VEGQISNIVDFGAFRRPRRHRRPDPHLRALLVARQPPVRDPHDRRHREGQGARHRPRTASAFSLGLKQTQEDPWQRIVDTYNVGDELEGKVTKVVTFGAFVEILDGVEGLVHISELAPHHVESPREIVSPGRRDPRERSSRSTPSVDACRCRPKRVEDQILPVSRPGEPEAQPV